jgi:H+-transporting ATPase
VRTRLWLAPSLSAIVSPGTVHEHARATYDPDCTATATLLQARKTAKTRFWRDVAQSKLSVGGADSEQATVRGASFARAGNTWVTQETQKRPVLKPFKEGAKAQTHIEQLDFEPFSAATRKTLAHVRLDHQDPPVEVSKGAILTLEDYCDCPKELRAQLDAQVVTVSKKGHRTLAVCVDSQICGLICLADPPRPTSATMVARLKELGIRVFMVTGDNMQVASFVAGAVGIGAPDTIGSMDQWRATHEEKYGHGHIVEPIHNLHRMNGLAQVLPEDKHAVVTMFQDAHEIVGMTGDGVNDAPALKLAEVGIAMSNATDVAKGAASLVLMTEGLDSVPIIVETGRRIHARLTTWVLIRLAKTFQTVGFAVLMYLITGTWIVTSLNLLELLFLVDFVSMALSTDNAAVTPEPCTWPILRILRNGVIIGLFNLGSAVGTWYALRAIWNLDAHQMNTYSFAIMFFMGIFTIFALRVRGFFWTLCPSLVLVLVCLADFIFVAITTMVGVPQIDLKQIPVGCFFFIAGCGLLTQVVLTNFLAVLLWRKFQMRRVYPKYQRVARETGSKLRNRGDLKSDWDNHDVTIPLH